jgi:hypothetical protein
MHMTAPFMCHLYSPPSEDEPGLNVEIRSQHECTQSETKLFIATEVAFRCLKQCLSAGGLQTAPSP